MTTIVMAPMTIMTGHVVERHAIETSVIKIVQLLAKIVVKNANCRNAE